MTINQAKAVLSGLALGDALGYPVEFLERSHINEIYGRHGIQEPGNPAMVTDDSQMTFAVGWAIAQNPDQPLEKIMLAMTRNIIEWSVSPKNNRAPGRACMEGAANLSRGMHYTRSGLKDARGCGSAMRVGAIGYLYQDDEDRLREISHASGICTHDNRMADASCMAAAYMVKLALDGVHPRAMIKPTLKFVEGVSSEFDEKLLFAEAIADAPVERMAEIGQGWRGHEAVALAWYCAARHPDSWLDAVRLAVNGLPRGDRDSIGCIAGGIMAARQGIGAVPEDWVARLEPEYLIEINELSRLLASGKAGIGGKA